jgi:hypothetical protein
VVFPFSESPSATNRALVPTICNCEAKRSFDVTKRFSLVFFIAAPCHVAQQSPTVTHVSNWQLILLNQDCYEVLRKFLKQGFAKALVTARWPNSFV